MQAYGTAEHNLELAKYDFELPPTLDNAEIASILPQIDDGTRPQIRRCNRRPEIYGCPGNGII